MDELRWTTADSKIVYIVFHAGDSHLENNNEGQSKLIEWLIVGDWRLLILVLQSKEVTTRHTAFQALT
jgi:hypothetical protein